jgi:hypothetical protein
MGGGAGGFPETNRGEVLLWWVHGLRAPPP